MTLQKKGTKKHRTLHSLVLETFKYPRPAGLVINHVNNIKHDNNLANLEYCTVRQNVQHCIAVGNFPNPLKTRKFKLSDETIRYIRTSSKRNIELSRELGIASSMICSIRKHVYYRHVSDE